MKLIGPGATGRMGQLLCQLAEQQGHTVAARVAVDAPEAPGYSRSLADCSAAADCVVDFSNHAATAELLAFCTAGKLPVVIATTGQTEEDMALIRQAAKVIPVFRSGNMALGVTLMCDLVKTAVKAFPDADVEILEIHHTRKVDAPSGTAVMLGNAALEARPDAHLTVGRPAGNAKRDKNEITIHSLRMGNIVGTHEVIFNARTQVITLKHEALDRAMFAEGAIIAAEFLLRQKPGLYDMQDLAAAL